MDKDDIVIDLYIPGTPKAIQSVRFANRGGFMTKYQPKANTDWKGYLKLSAIDQIQEGFKPLQGCLKFEVLYAYDALKSFTKKKKQWLADGNVIMKPSRPDLQDNLSKGVCDAMTGILWQDDSQIVWTEGFKMFCEKGPGILIRVTQVEENLTADQLPVWIQNFLKG
jgi:Holliday junction resolvase RusA-like endonuclease